MTPARRWKPAEVVEIVTMSHSDPQKQSTGCSCERNRLRLAVLDAASSIDVALDSEPVVMTAMLLEVLDRLELVLDEVAA